MYFCLRRDVAEDRNVTPSDIIRFLLLEILVMWNTGAGILSVAAAHQLGCYEGLACGLSGTIRGISIKRTCQVTKGDAGHWRMGLLQVV